MDPENIKESLTGRIIAVDDDQIVLKNLRRILEKSGHIVSTFAVASSKGGRRISRQVWGRCSTEIVIVTAETP